MNFNDFIKEHFDDKYYRAKHFGVRYILDWTLCSFARKFGISCRRVDPNEVDFRYVKRRYRQLAEQVNYEPEYKDGDTIWVMWWQGADVEKPSLIETCIESIKRNRGEYKVVVVDQYNYRDYINIPQFILDKFNRGIIGIAAFSDYIRFALMEKYGGWYLDATIYVTKIITKPKDSFYSIKYDGLYFQIPRGKWSAYLWYLPQDHPLASFVHQVFDDYWTNHDKIVNYFLIDCIVKTLYELNYEFKSQIDLLSCDNPNLFFLQTEGCKLQFDEKMWVERYCRTQFFKCNRKKEITARNSYAAIILDAN